MDPRLLLSSKVTEAIETRFNPLPKKPLTERTSFIESHVSRLSTGGDLEAKEIVNTRAIKPGQAARGVMSPSALSRHPSSFVQIPTAYTFPCLGSFITRSERGFQSNTAFASGKAFDGWHAIWPSFAVVGSGGRCLQRRERGRRRRRRWSSKALCAWAGLRREEAVMSSISRGGGVIASRSVGLGR